MYTNLFHSSALQKITQIWILVLKMYHLATLLWLFFHDFELFFSPAFETLAFDKALLNNW
jgi:hypothetical protein